MRVTLVVVRLAIFCCVSLTFLGVLHAAKHELPITTGLALWLDAGKGVTTSGTTVTKWADQSGNGHDGTYTSGAPQIAVFPPKTSTMPAVIFDGANDYFELAGGPVITGPSFTIFTVAFDKSPSNESPPNTSNREIYSNWDFGNTFSSVNLGSIAAGQVNRSARFAGNLTVPDAVPPNLLFLSGAYQAGVSSSLFSWNGFGSPPLLLGSTVQNNNPSTAANRNGARDLTTQSFIGRQGSLDEGFWQGNIHELLVYDGLLTANQQDQVISYLHDKWAPLPEPSSVVLLVLPGF